MPKLFKLCCDNVDGLSVSGSTIVEMYDIITRKLEELRWQNKIVRSSSSFEKSQIEPPQAFAQPTKLVGLQRTRREYEITSRWGIKENSSGRPITRTKNHEAKKSGIERRHYPKWRSGMSKRKTSYCENIPCSCRGRVSILFDLQMYEKLIIWNTKKC